MNPANIAGKERSLLTGNMPGIRPEMFMKMMSVKIAVISGMNLSPLAPMVGRVI